jgi:uncharacterized protein
MRAPSNEPAGYLRASYDASYDASYIEKAERLEPNMRAVEAITLLRQHRPDLERLGVDHLYLFGSTARGEARAGSDIDLFFDHRQGELGLYQLIDVKELTSRILGRPADIMTRSSLHPILRNEIEASALRVF